jgi:hypothetical protein
MSTEHILNITRCNILNNVFAFKTLYNIDSVNTLKYYRSDYVSNITSLYPLSSLYKHNLDIIGFMMYYTDDELLQIFHSRKKYLILYKFAIAIKFNNDEFIELHSSRALSFCTMTINATSQLTEICVANDRIDILKKIYKKCPSQPLKLKIYELCCKYNNIDHIEYFYNKFESYQIFRRACNEYAFDIIIHVLPHINTSTSILINFIIALVCDYNRIPYLYNTSKKLSTVNQRIMLYAKPILELFISTTNTKLVHPNDLRKHNNYLLDKVEKILGYKIH